MIQKKPITQWKQKLVNKMRIPCRASTPLSLSVLNSFLPNVIAADFHHSLFDNMSVHTVLSVYVFFQISMTSGAVSYTHLDVYKRQE